MNEQRRTLLAAAGLIPLVLGAAALAQPAPRVIKVSARRFVFTPGVIALR